MPAHSMYLAKLSSADRQKLESALLEKQNGFCFLCNKTINLTLQPDIHIDHVQPIAQQGADHPNNFALMHGVCNEKKGSTNLEIARRLFHFEELQADARKAGDRGADLDDILRDAGGEGLSLALEISRKRFITHSRTIIRQSSIQVPCSPTKEAAFVISSLFCRSTISIMMTGSILARLEVVSRD